LTYIIVDQPTNGTVTVDGTGPTVTYVPNAGYLGSDSFTFKVNDGQVDSGVATVATTVVDNQAPRVTIDSPTVDTVAIPWNVGVLLEATVFDDTKPAPASIAWSQISGPATATFESPNTADTAVNFPPNITGTYVLRLTAGDGVYSASDTVTIEVGYYDTSKDQGPYVLVGAEYAGRIGTAISLHSVSIVDDGLPNPPALTTIRWEMHSGPGNVAFSDVTIASPTATCDTAGQYVLRVSAFDGSTRTYRDVPVAVTPNTAPQAFNDAVSTNQDVPVAIPRPAAPSPSAPYRTCSTPRPRASAAQPASPSR
jgi:hypothetical protein